MFSIMGNCMSWIRKKKSPYKRLTLVMIGLDNAGKTSVAKSLQGERLHIEVAPTVGFSSLQFKKEKFDITVYDLGGGKNIRAIWRNYFSEVFAVIYVIDASDTERVEECKNVLSDILSNRRIAGKPVLILANKQDREGALDGVDICNLMDLEEVANANKCPTRVETCTIKSGRVERSSGPGRGRVELDRSIVEGFDWLLKTVARQYEQLSRRVEQEAAMQREAEERDKQERLMRVRKVRQLRGEASPEAHEVKEDAKKNPFLPVQAAVQNAVQGDNNNSAETKKKKIKRHGKVKHNAVAPMELVTPPRQRSPSFEPSPSPVQPSPPTGQRPSPSPHLLPTVRVGSGDGEAKKVRPPTPVRRKVSATPSESMQNQERQSESEDSALDSPQPRRPSSTSRRRNRKTPPSPDLPPVPQLRRQSPSSSVLSQRTTPQPAVVSSSQQVTPTSSHQQLSRRVKSDDSGVDVLPEKNVMDELEIGGSGDYAQMSKSNTIAAASDELTASDSSINLRKKKHRRFRKQLSGKSASGNVGGGEERPAPAPRRGGRRSDAGDGDDNPLSLKKLPALKPPRTGLPHLSGAGANGPLPPLKSASQSGKLGTLRGRRHDDEPAVKSSTESFSSKWGLIDDLPELPPSKHGILRANSEDTQVVT